MKTIKEIINDYKYEKEELSTGFSSLDEGFMIRMSEVTVIASRPYMTGRYNLALSVISNIVNNDISALVISNNTNNYTLMDLIMINSDYNLSNLCEKDLKSDDRILKILDDLKKKNIYIDNTYADVSTRIDNIRKLKNEDHNLKVVLIEYSLDSDVAKYKVLARELNIAIIMLFTLSKKLEKRDDKRPLQCDLSSKIFDSADNVLFIYRDDYYKKCLIQKVNL